MYHYCHNGKMQNLLPSYFNLVMLLIMFGCRFTMPAKSLHRLPQHVQWQTQGLAQRLTSSRKLPF